MSEYLTTNWRRDDSIFPLEIQQSGISYLPSSAFEPFSVAVCEIRNKKSVKISDVKILSPNKVVQVIFEDGTSEKAV